MTDLIRRLLEFVGLFFRRSMAGRPPRRQQAIAVIDLSTALVAMVPAGRGIMASRSDEPHGYLANC